MTIVSQQQPRTHDTKRLMGTSNRFSLNVFICQSADIIELAMLRWDTGGVGGSNREGEERNNSKGEE